MATSGHVAQDGGQGNVKLHPYIVTLIRWCVSCVWSTATILLHRLMTTPLQPIAGPKSNPRSKVPKRAAGTEHLHPEPRVACQLLHQPAIHTLDVIFVHGLYGSLGNTWRQGDWRQKYASEPKIVTLRDHPKTNPCNCRENPYKKPIHNENICNNLDNATTYKKHELKEDDVTDDDPEMSLTKINEKLSKKIIPIENDLITEQFYNNTLIDQVENYETQAKFVRDMFKKEINCDTSCETNSFKYNEENNKFICNKNSNNDYKCTYNDDKLKYNDDNRYNNENTNENDLKSEDNEFKCKYNKVNDFNECKCGPECEVGCGCVCNECYSTCWPRDWIKEDFPGARVISINYTSDPYLWRPLWIKENKRLNLYQRAEQMIEQLLEMGVGEKPVIWVGHSKGGLFIKQIYCEAYDAYLKLNKNLTSNDETEPVFPKNVEDNSSTTHNGITAANIDTIIGHFNKNKENNNSSINENCSNEINDNKMKKNDNYSRVNDNASRENDNASRENDNASTVNDNASRVNDNASRGNDNASKENHNASRENDNASTDNDNYLREDNYMSQNDNHSTRKDDNFIICDNYRDNNNITNNNACVMNKTVEYENVFKQISAKNDSNNDTAYLNMNNDNIRNIRIESGDGNFKAAEDIGNIDLASSIEDGVLVGRASLWSRSRGFMFYSVPHRGSPLADIKTPVTARSVDLLEIAKDCPLVVGLQARWERAVGSVVPVGSVGRAPAVRSVVETCRTLMSVLWLRIVSTDSADAGIGTLSGIAVDHREICKPTSRACRLYTMLTDLIHDATTCKCH